MKLFNISLLSLMLFVTISCFKDKGNYDYSEAVHISIESEADKYSGLRAIDPIVIKQTITSSTEGEIVENNPNMEFSYSISVTDPNTKSYWTQLSEGEINFNQTVDYPTGIYTLWFKMLDKRTDLITSKTYSLTISSATYEGWMILGTEGSENNTRMDMISVVSTTREELNFDIMKNRGLPAETKGAYCFGYWPNSNANNPDKMYLFSDTGGYFLEKEEFTTSEKSTINFTDFIMPSKLKAPVATYVFIGHNIIVTTEGDAYVQCTDAGGPRFLDPINTTVRGSAPEFKVAPFVGYNAVRPGNPYRLGVLYDITNKRFMRFNSYSPNSESLYALVNSGSDNKFNYKTDKDLVYMVGTAYDSGVAFSLLRDDDGKFYIAGLSVKSNISQYNYIENVAAPELSKAKYFAFHSKYPIMYYAVENKVYAYNWSNQTSNSTPVITVDSEITMIKFQLYSNVSKLPKYSDPDFVEQQYNLLVASHNGSENGGKLGFYKTSDEDHSVSKVKEYSGFCKIKDVIYRERR